MTTLKNILVATDISSPSRHAADRAARLARAAETLHADLGVKPADWTPRVFYGDASLCIVEQEQDQDCDLIVIGKRGQNLTEELLLGSVTRHVLTEPQGDVLVSTLRSA